MDYVEEYFKKIYDFKTYEEIKGFKMPKYEPIKREDKNRIEEKSREICSYHVLNIYLLFRKISLKVCSFVKRSR